MIKAMVVYILAISVPLTSFANTTQETSDSLEQAYFVETDARSTQILFESQELVKTLYKRIHSEGIDVICTEMQLEPITPFFDDLGNLPSGTLLLFGSSETDIQTIAYVLQAGQCLQISSQNEDAHFEMRNLANLNVERFPYLAVYRLMNVVTPTDTKENYTTDPSPFLEENFDQYFVNEECLPYVLSPKGNEITLETFNAWAMDHQDELRKLIASQGAVLLRGFPIEGAEGFAEVVKAVIGKELIDYRGEGSRKRIIQGVYTSTEAPPEFKIPLHNELSCTNNPIDYICFYCAVAPEPGTGQTLLGRTEDVTIELMNRPQVWDMFDGKILKYTSRHPYEGCTFTSVNPSHKTWPDAFGTTDRDEVERICEEKGYKCKWLGDWLKVVRYVPATRGPDEYFDHTYWFNQAYLYHANPRIRGGWINHLLANLLYITPSTRQYDIEFIDGSPIPQEIVYEIYDVLDQVTIRFNWEKDDVLLLDNHRTLHGRAPCNGERRILTSMIQ